MANQVSDTEITALLTQGVRLGQHRLYEQALIVFSQAIQLRPDLADGYFNQGVALGQLGRIHEAIAPYEETIRLEPDRAEAHFNLGNIYVKAGNLDRAQACFERAIRLRSGYAKALKNLANICVRRGEHQRAQSLLREAEQANPEYQRQLAEKERQTGNISAAIHRLHELALKGSSQASLQLAILLRDLQRFGDALAIADHAVMHKQFDAKLLCLRAEVRCRLKLLDDALDDAAAAIQLEPQSYEGYFCLGQTQFAKGLAEKAVASFERALALNPQSKEVMAAVEMARTNAQKLPAPRTPSTDTASSNAWVLIPPISRYGSSQSPATYTQNALRCVASANTAVPVHSENAGEATLLRKPRFGIVIGQFDSADFVKLNVAAIRRHCGDWPILIVDDASPGSEFNPPELGFAELLSVAAADPAARVWKNDARVGHVGGDLFAVFKGIIWAAQLELTTLVKLSQRFVINRPGWIEEASKILQTTDAAVLGRGCTHFQWKIRTEAMVLDVASWNHPEILKTLLNPPNAQFAERVIEAIIDERFPDRYQEWPLLGPSRQERKEGILFRATHQSHEYAALAQSLGLTPGIYRCSPTELQASYRA